ncbi:FAD-dependent oxidoreductase [Pseudophaeobacter sp. C1-32P7]|uniref:oxidoreductase n=1 Tax=Pseudophaeobacter sp. C1-32P7 TaxID=3098142 RepID=UPI0034D694C0
MTTFPHIFRPVTLRHKTLRNRIVFGAHTTNMAHGGLPGEAHSPYYRERALGGAAMIVVEPMPVHAAAVLTRGNFLHSSDEVIPHFRRLTEAAQAEGAVMIQQLYHVGAHGDQDNSWHAAWSPSGGPSFHDSDASHAMSEAEIEESIEGFVQAAIRCQKAGFDGVEVWAAYHCLLDQFWTPFSNQRDDRWGGSLENRTRLSRTILHRIRRACGEDFIIGLSVNDEPGVDVALSRESMAEIIALHDSEGAMDYVTVGSGSYFDFARLLPSFQHGEKLTSDLAGTLKAAVQQALVTSESHIRTPENANTLLGAGEADLVSLVRGQIADPHLVAKAEAGRAEDIRGCLSCNQQCWGRRSRDYWISCLVNPSAGREHDWGGDRFTPTSDPKKVLVVGGGPAGLEAARVAAERGHHVTLVEAAAHLGGQFHLAGLQPRRGQITDLISWYDRQLTRLGVDVRLNTYMDAEDIKGEGADRVVLATGSQPPETGFQKALPHLAHLPGIEHGHVWSAEDVMARRARLGQEVIVLDEGGNWRGCGTAWRLAEDGRRVTLVTPDPMVGKELQRSATDLHLRRALAELGVAFVTEAAIAGWDGQGATVTCLLTGSQRAIPADDLVMAVPNHADMSLRDELIGLGVTPQLVGDADAPRMAAQAIFDGRRVGLAL